MLERIKDKYPRPVSFLFFLSLSFSSLAILASGAEAKTLSIPAPCSDDVNKAAQLLKSDSTIAPKIQDIIAHPECLNILESCSARKSFVIDQIVLNVATRMQNLYQGYNGRTNVSFTNGGTTSTIPAENAQTHPVWADTSGFKDLSKGNAACGNSGACNVFCGEGIAPERFPSLNGLPYNYNIDSNGPDLFPDTRNVNIPALHTTANPGILPAAYRNDFIAKGIFANSNTAAGGYPYLTGWPAQDLDFYPNDWVRTCGAGREDSEILSGENHRLKSGRLSVGWFWFRFNSIVWNDGSFRKAVDGREACDFFYQPGYAKANSIAALHTGALVQANWMKLQEVLDEIRSNNGLLTVHDQCLNYATDYLDGINTVIGATYKGQFCNMNAADLIAGCAGTNAPGGLNKCYMSEVKTKVQLEGFPQIAECEVYTRANDFFADVFLSNEYNRGKGYINQLKNWAFSGCFRASNDAMQFFQGTNVSTSTLKFKSKDVNDLHRLLATHVGAYKAVQSNCSPYAYTALFTQFLKNNGFKRVPIQDSFVSGQAWPNTKNVMPIAINNCRVTVTKNPGASQ